MLAATFVGDVAPMAAVSVAAVCALLLAKRRREACYLIVAAGGCLLLNLALKLIFHRARPNQQLAYLLPQPSSLSFPSGHAMGSAGVLGSLIVIAYALRWARSLRWIVTALGVSAIGAIGASRIYLGAHYPSDVLGGFLAAAAWLAAVTGWFYPRLLPGEHSPMSAETRTWRFTPPPVAKVAGAGSRHDVSVLRVGGSEGSPVTRNNDAKQPRSRRF